MKFSFFIKVTFRSQSLPSQGAWIEILFICTVFGLLPSLPSQGAWIEIAFTFSRRFFPKSLPSQGAWIEIFFPLSTLQGFLRRSPHRERGLKYCRKAFLIRAYMSLPSQGAWIEILKYLANLIFSPVAPLTGSVD